jgi:hypothetical protein
VSKALAAAPRKDDLAVDRSGPSEDQPYAPA